MGRGIWLLVVEKSCGQTRTTADVPQSVGRAHVPWLE